MRTSMRGTAVLLAALAVIAAAAVAAVANGPSSTAAAATTGCQLGNGVKHVIEITFDNVHFNRDNPNVLSDLEQLPALENFITQNGTMLSNNHTPLIAHTADDTITNYSGLYGDRQGQGLTNTYETYNADGSVTPKSSFAYWTSTYNVDAFPNQPYSANVPAFGSAPATPPAPWVPFTRAGCDVGDVSTANMELENLSPDIANFFGPTSPEQAQLTADPDPFKDQEANDYEGLGVHCAQGSSFCSTDVRPVTDSLPSEPGGYNGFQAVFGHKYLQPQLKAAANQADGSRIVNGDTYPVYDANGNLVDLNGKEIDGPFAVNGKLTPGFPGFGGISAAQSLAYVADLQETGVPVTYAYISDAHEKKTGQTGCSNSGTAQGPGDTCYEQTLASYNASFAKFFKRLADDGINASNTEFVVTADEGDHFAGANAHRAVQPVCAVNSTTGLSQCSYPKGTLGEMSVSIHGLLANQLGDTTPFYNEPQGNSVFITGNPGPNAPQTRTLERDFANVQANDVYDGNVSENVAQYMADPEVEQLLHFVNADPNRTPTFTVFPKPDFFLTSGTTDGNAPCASGVTQATAAQACSSINNGFAWDHGYYTQEIDNTWVGFVGPGVAHKGIDGLTPAEGPSSDGSANSSPQPVTALKNPGTWADMTDIRPTLLSLVGLKDDYVGDGRVLTEDLTVSPGNTGDKRYQSLAECYKQLNSSVGTFGTDMLLADTAALKTGSASGDGTYQAVSGQIAKLGAERDQLATEIKQDLWSTAFAGGSIPKGNSTVAHCQNVLRQADSLAQGKQG